jgi:hypothetical protein
MNTDRVEQIRIGCSHDRGRGAARGKPGDRDTCSVDVEIAHDLARNSQRQQSGLERNLPKRLTAPHGAGVRTVGAINPASLKRPIATLLKKSIKSFHKQSRVARRYRNILRREGFTTPAGANVLGWRCQGPTVMHA